MSLSEEHPLTCPGCNATSIARIYRSVNAERAPELKEQLLKGQLFTFTCTSCGQASRVVHPELFYHDHRGGFLVQMDALGKFDASTLRELECSLPPISRVVRDSNALLEKVHVFDSGFDDRVIEVLKVVVAVQKQIDTATRFLFEGMTIANVSEESALRFTLLTTNGVSGLAVPRTAYERLRASLEADGKLTPLPAWAVVDFEYARLALRT